MRTEFWWGNLKERNQFDDLGVDGRIILKRSLNKLGWRARDVLIWTSGRLL